MTTTGGFAWHELHTRDPGRAATFYRELLGWTIEDVGGVGEPYARCTRPDVGVSVVASKAPPQVPSFWLPYLAVGDVDAAAARAVALGARVVRPPGETRGAGRAAIVADPRGALVGLCAATPAADGSFAWDELLTDDPDAAAGFYAALCGLSTESVDAGPAGTYRILRAGDRRVAGIAKHPEAVHPHWLPYLAVADVDAAVGRAVGLGASIYFGARDVPGFGRFAAIDDPTGAGVCLLRASPGPK